MTTMHETAPASFPSASCQPAPRPGRARPSADPERAAVLRVHRDVALRIIANDLRRLAGDLDLLEGSGDVPERLAALVAAVRVAVGRPAPLLELAPIAEAVCAAFRVTHDEIVSRRRGQHLAMARQVAVYLMREITDYSFPRIADYFGRDHSTAIHSYTQIARRVAAESSFRTLMEKLKESLAARSAAPAHAVPPGAAQSGRPAATHLLKEYSQ